MSRRERVSIAAALAFLAIVSLLHGLGLGLNLINMMGRAQLLVLLLGAAVAIVLVFSLKLRSNDSICLEIAFPRLTQAEIMRADTVKLEEIIRNLSRHAKVRLIVAGPDAARLYVYGRGISVNELASLIRDYTEAIMARPCSNGAKMCAIEVASTAVAEKIVKRIVSGSKTKILIIDFKGIMGEFESTNVGLINLGDIISIPEKVKHAVAGAEKVEPNLLVLVEPLDLMATDIEYICSYANQCIVITTSSGMSLPPCTIDV